MENNEKDLSIWNRHVLMLSEALICQIDENFRAVDLYLEDKNWVAYFYLLRPSEKSLEQVRDIIDRFIELGAESELVKEKIVFGSNEMPWPDNQNRPVFRRKEDSD